MQRPLLRGTVATALFSVVSRSDLGLLSEKNPAAGNPSDKAFADGHTASNAPDLF